MRRSLLLLVFLAACATKQTDDDSATGASSDLTTDVLAPNVAALEVGPNGELKVVTYDAKDSILDPARGTVSPDPVPRRMLPGYTHATPIGWDPQWFYFYAQISDNFYGGRRIYRLASDPAATPEALGDVGNGENAPDPLAAIVDGGTVWWATYPNTCTIGAGDSCWQMSLGKAAAGGTYDRNTPRLADGTYVALGQLAFYEGDLYGASSTGVFKVPAGDVTKPVERVCSFPAGFKTKMTNSTILAGSAHSSFAVSAKGFIVPLQSADYQSALGLLKWDCSTEQLTPFGPAATGSARTFGFLQIQDIVVQGNTIYWLDRQEYSPAETWADSFFALKRTKL